MDTKRKVEADGNFKVVAGYFAVATDGYVRGKVNRLEPWMTAAARVDMCKAVAQDVNWNISASEFAGWKQCGTAMIAQHHTKNTKVFGVRDEAKKGGVHRKGDGPTAELSSTWIRAQLTKRGCTPQVVDDLVDQRVLGRAVGECLKQKLGHVQKVQSCVDCICCEGTGKLLESECPLCDGLARFPVEEESALQGCSPAEEQDDSMQREDDDRWRKERGKKKGTKGRK